MQDIIDPYAPITVLSSEWNRFNTLCCSPHHVTSFFLSTDPLVVAVLLCVVFTLLTWIVSVLTGNCSQVDRLWSILPVIYSWIFAFHPSAVGDTRLLVMAILSTLWGIRLTFNFWRKGGYKSGEEDYRWPLIRKIIANGFLFQIFQLIFISIYQNLLLLLFVLPCYMVWRARGMAPFGVGDNIITALFLILLIVETISDQQQWVFQTKKYAMIKSGQRRQGAFLAGFIVDGLFKYSRHPNFFCEIMLWWCYYAFTVSATGVLINWSVLGTVLLTLLFQGSTTFTEYVTSKKYPVYKIYQECTSRLVPMLPNKARDILEKYLAELKQKDEKSN